MKLEWSARSRRDLLAIGDRIVADNPPAALAFVERLRSRAMTAVRFPQSGRIVPEVQDPAIREFIEGNYRIVYRLKAQVVSVLTIFEGHQLLRAEAIVHNPPPSKGGRPKRAH